MSHIFPRNMKSLPPTAVNAQGCYIYDSTGKAYLDGSGGAAVSCSGHGDPDIIAAVQKQAEALSFAHTGFFTSEPAEDLAEILIHHAPEGLDRVYLVSGGSEATEAAIKLARQYHIENGAPERRHLIARKQSYHGNTLEALAAGGNEWRRAQFSPLLIDVTHISPCYEYVLRGADETAFDYGQRMAQELEDENFILMGPDHTTQTQLFQAFEQAGVKLKSSIHSHLFKNLLSFVKEDMGVALVDDFAIENDHDPRFISRPFTPQIYTDMAIITSATRPLSQIGSEFLDLLQQKLKHYAAH